MTNFNIKTIEMAGLGSALQALRLPFGKECRSKCAVDIDSILAKNTPYHLNEIHIQSDCIFNDKDLKLLSTLVKRGNEHAKVMRGIMVWAEIEAPIYFYRELETYRIGRERLASESTMHIQCQGLSGEELEKAKEEMLMGTMQKTVDMYSYQCLRNIYFQRKDHRLPMWHKFCSWIESLPFANELIICTNDNKENN